MFASIDRMSDEPEARLPEDPTGIEEPHDVLAAEEFAMPTGGGTDTDSGAFDPRSLIPAAALIVLLLLLLGRRRR